MARASGPPRWKRRAIPTKDWVARTQLSPPGPRKALPEDRLIRATTIFFLDSTHSRIVLPAARKAAGDADVAVLLPDEGWTAAARAGAAAVFARGHCNRFRP